MNLVQFRGQLTWATLGLAAVMILGLVTKAIPNDIMAFVMFAFRALVILGCGVGFWLDYKARNVPGMIWEAAWGILFIILIAT